MLSFSDIKMGKVVVYNDQPCVITKCDFLKMNRAKPSKKCILKSLTTGNNMEYNFKSGESIDEADIAKRKASFLYATGDSYSFMLDDTFETVEIDKEMLGGKEVYITEGLEVFVVYFQDAVISVDMPIKISLKVEHAPEVAKGNTVNSVMKDARLETGAIVKVPSFIKTGEQIIVNTVEDEYVERDNS